MASPTTSAFELKRSRTAPKWRPTSLPGLEKVLSDKTVMYCWFLSLISRNSVFEEHLWHDVLLFVSSKELQVHQGSHLFHDMALPSLCIGQAEIKAVLPLHDTWSRPDLLVSCSYHTLLSLCNMSPAYVNISFCRNRWRVVGYSY